MPVIVRQLGTSHDAHPYCSVGELHKHGRVAVPLLVRQLVVLQPKTRWDAKVHVIWCVRALRSITGQKFQFPTRNKRVLVYDCFMTASSCPGHWRKNTGEPLPFFWERMSRATYHFSPPDVRWRVRSNDADLPPLVTCPDRGPARLYDLSLSR